MRADPGAFRRRAARRRRVGASSQAEMLRLHVCRRLSERLDGIDHGPGGSIDKLLMTWVEQTVGHAALVVGGAAHGGDDDDVAEGVPLQPGAERHGRHVADPEEHRRHAASSGLPDHDRRRYDLPDEIAGRGRRAGPHRARSTGPSSSTPSTTSCTSGSPSCSRSSTPTPTRGPPSSPATGRAFSAGGDFDLPRRAGEATRDLRRETIADGRELVIGMVALPRAGRRRGQRSGRRARLQPGRAVRRRVHGRDGAPRRPARHGRARRRRRRPAHLAAAHQPAAGQGVRVHRRPHPGRSAPPRSGWPTTCAPTTRCSTRPLACAHKIAKLPQQAVEDTKRILNLHLERAVLATIDFAMAAEDRSFDSPELRANLDRFLAPQPRVPPGGSSTAAPSAPQRRRRVRVGSRSGGEDRAPPRVGGRGAVSAAGEPKQLVEHEDRAARSGGAGARW